jgi:hypothetical protein
MGLETELTDAGSSAARPGLALQRQLGRRSPAPDFGPQRGVGRLGEGSLAHLCMTRYDITRHLQETTLHSCTTTKCFKAMRCFMLSSFLQRAVISIFGRFSVYRYLLGGLE